MLDYLDTLLNKISYFNNFCQVFEKKLQAGQTT